MKRVMIGVLAAMVLNACMQDIPVPYPYGGGGREPRFTTGGPERTAVDEGGRTKWAEGDGIGIYMTGTKDGSILAGNVEYRSNGANGFSVVNSGQRILYPEGDGKVNFTAYYPYTEPLEDRYIPVDLTEQSGDDRRAALDLLWVKADRDGEGYDQDSGAVNLVFAHALSKLSVTVQSDGLIDLTGMAVVVTGVNRQARFDIRNGAVSSPGDPGEITPLCTVEPNGTEIGGIYEAVLFPGGTGGVAIELAVNNKTYTWNIDSTFGGFAGGKEYHAAITVSSRTLTVTGTEGGIGWTDSGGTYTVQSSWPFSIEGYTGDVKVTYTDESVTETDAGMMRLVYGKTVKSVTLINQSNKTYLVGRVVDSYSPLRLKFDDSSGDLVFRKADTGGYIPVGSYAEFQLIRTNAAFSMGKKFKQEADLDLMDLEWDPVANDWGHSYGIFDGEFNGGGYKLSNLKIDQSAIDYRGLFSRNRGTIRDVHIASGAVRGKWYCGAVCGSNESTGSMISCSNGADVTGTDGVSEGVFGGSKVCYNTGGVAGQNKGGSIVACRNTGAVSGGNGVGGVAGANTDGSMTGCSNAGTVSGKLSIGGVVGGNGISDGASGTFAMTDCYNTGKVNGTGSTGGVAGGTSSRIPDNYFFLIDCYNTGEVTGGNTKTGGVVGESSRAFFTGCYNTGTVAGTGDTYYTGGVAGYAELGSMTGCYNTGAVSGNTFVGGVAGIAGRYRAEFDMTGCYNAGIVSGTGSYIGGVAGDIDYGTADGCYNSGTVSGGDDVGGVAGGIGSATDCYNTGDVSGYLRVGGVAGNVSGGSMNGCYNTGDVSGPYYVGGVAGEIMNSATITGCYNTGTVSGGGNVGGVTGINSSQSKIIACYNTGSVSGGGGIGGVTGCHKDNSSITACYNTGGVSGTSDYIGGVAGHVQNGSIAACYNTGDVSGTERVGGVAGDAVLSGLVGGSSITACYNTGGVSGTSYVGGVAGLVGGSSITACYNTGSVSGTFHVGGVVGSNGESSVTACYNTGGVSGTERVGGVAGNVSSGSSITACYNTGGVRGTFHVGGVAGSLYSSITACYWFDQGNTAANNAAWGIGYYPPSDSNAARFGPAAWPAPADHTDWETGISDGTAGNYWLSTGGWNDGNPVYPKLWWE